MNWSAELLRPGLGQRLLTGWLRASTWLVFRSGMHPVVPPRLQRGVLRLATLTAPRARACVSSPECSAACPANG